MSFRIGGFKCKACGSKDNQQITGKHLDFKAINHATFEPDPKLSGLNLSICNRCGHAYNLAASNNKEKIQDYFLSTEYGMHSEKRLVVVPEKKEAHNLMSYIDSQAVFLTGLNRLFGLGNSYLDIGCFDGRLLGSIRELDPNAVTVGYDVFHHPDFKSISNDSEFNAHVFSSNINKEAITYDTIVFSHSLIYIDNIADVLRASLTLLKSPGLMYIEVPDTNLRPSTLLLGDQFHYFTKKSLCMLAQACGYNIYLDYSISQKGDLAALLFKDCGDFTEFMLTQSLRKRSAGELTRKKDIVNYLQDTNKKVNNIPSSKRVGILGTSYSSSFVAQCLTGRDFLFIDEHPRSDYFYGKTIYTVESAPPLDFLIAPLGNNAIQTCGRLAQSLNKTKILPIII